MKLTRKKDDSRFRARVPRCYEETRREERIYKRSRCSKFSFPRRKWRKHRIDEKLRIRNEIITRLASLLRILDMKYKFEQNGEDILLKAKVTAEVDTNEIEKIRTKLKKLLKILINNLKVIFEVKNFATKKTILNRES